MPQVTSRGVDHIAERPMLTMFGLGVGVHLDVDLDSTEPSPATIAFLHDIGVTRYRLNLRWNVIARGPGGGIDHGELDRLGAMVERLLDAGIEPLVALDNSSLPPGSMADGGWRNAATAWAYGDFVGAVGARLGELVDEWITIADAQPQRSDQSMTSMLIAAHIESMQILRAHAPHARVGASIDVSPFDESIGLGDAEASQAWIAHLASGEVATDFLAINVDQVGRRSPAGVADTIRSLHRNLPGQSFCLVEARAAVDRRRRADRVVGVDTLPSYRVVDGFLEQIRDLRAEQIDVNGTFTWPFGGANADRVSISEATLEGYRRLTSGALC